MSEPTMVERLAERWQTEGPQGDWGLLDYCDPDDADREARWWLRAIAEEIDANPDTGFFPVADWLRSEADR
jgi:hypothetical protein